MPSNMVQNESRTSTEGNYAVAFLACRIIGAPSTFTGLLLSRPQGSYQYHVGAPFTGVGFIRYITFDGESLSTLFGNQTALQWTDLYIAQPVDTDATLPVATRHSTKLPSPYVIVPRWSFAPLTDVGFHIVKPTEAHSPIPISTTSGLATAFVLLHREERLELRVHIGYCGPTEGLWMTIEITDVGLDSYSTMLAEPTHSPLFSRIRPLATSYTSKSGTYTRLQWNHGALYSPLE